MPDLHFTAARLADGLREVEAVLASPLVDEAVASIRALLASSYRGLERPVVASAQSAVDAQFKAAMPGDANVLAGDIKDDIGAHIEAALRLHHPLDGADNAQPDLVDAVDWICSQNGDSDRINRIRQSKVRECDRLVDLLRPVDERLCALQSPAAARLLNGGSRRPSRALYAAFIRAIEWPDATSRRTRLWASRQSATTQTAAFSAPS
jgi:hypothetical protein